MQIVLSQLSNEATPFEACCPRLSERATRATQCYREILLEAAHGVLRMR